MNRYNDVSVYANNFLTQLVDFLPRLIAALVILLIGYIIAKVVASLVRKGLHAVRLNERLHSTRGGGVVQRAVSDPTTVISKIAYWLIFLFVLSAALTALGIPAVNDFLRGLFGYVPNVIAALLIFLVAGGVSAAASSIINSTMGNTPTGKIAATAAPIVVMGLATFMILNQLQIATEIVTITYAGLVLTAVLAFGLGGRDAAGRMIDGLYEQGQARAKTVADDVRQGANNARSKAQDLRRRNR